MALNAREFEESRMLFVLLVLLEGCKGLELRASQCGRHLIPKKEPNNPPEVLYLPNVSKVWAFSRKVRLCMLASDPDYRRDGLFACVVLKCERATT